MFANEIDMNKFSITPAISRGQNSWSSVISYENKTLIIQTPELPLAFDLNSYQYPNSNKTKYSVTISLPPTIHGVNELQERLIEIDTCTKNSFKDEIGKEAIYYHAIHKSKNEKYSDTFRAKLVSNTMRFKCVIMVNGRQVSDKITDVQKLLTKGTIAKYQIQLNPIWKVGNKYGVSYQVLAVDVIKPEIEFRVRFPPKEMITEEEHGDSPTSPTNGKVAKNDGFIMEEPTIKTKQT